MGTLAQERLPVKLIKTFSMFKILLDNVPCQQSELIKATCDNLEMIEQVTPKKPNKRKEPEGPDKGLRRPPVKKNALSKPHNESQGLRRSNRLAASQKP